MAQGVPSMKVYLPPTNSKRKLSIALPELEMGVSFPNKKAKTNVRLHPLKTIEFERLKDCAPLEVIKHIQSFLDPKSLYAFYRTCQYTNAEFNLKKYGAKTYSFWDHMSSLSLLATSDENKSLFDPELPITESIFVDSFGNSLFSNVQFLEEVWLLAAVSGSCQILKNLIKTCMSSSDFLQTFASSMHCVAITMGAKIMDACGPSLRFPVLDLIYRFEELEFEPFKSLQICKLGKEVMHGDCPFVVTAMLLSIFDTEALKTFASDELSFGCLHFQPVNPKRGNARKDSIAFRSLVLECATWAGNIQTVEYLRQLEVESEMESEIGSESESEGGIERGLFDISKVDIKPKAHFSCYRHAARRGNLEVLVYLMERYDSISALLEDEYCTILMKLAIRGGHLDCLQYLWSLFINSEEDDSSAVPNQKISRSCAISGIQLRAQCAEMVYAAIKYSRASVLQWLLDQKISFSEFRAFKLAITSQFPLTILPILHHWAFKTDCSDSLSFVRLEKHFSPSQTRSFLILALELKHDKGLKIIKWFLRKRHYYKEDLHSTYQLVNLAMKGWNFKTLLCFKSNFQNFEWPPLLVQHCIKTRPARLLETLEWLLQEGCPPANYYELFVENGYPLAYLDWALKLGFPLTVELFQFASRGPNNQSLLKWLIDNNCPQPI